MAPARRLGRPRRCLAAIGQLHRPQPGVDAEPTQGLGLPGGRAMPHPGEVGQRRVRPGDEVGQRAPGQVGGGHPVAHVATGPGQARVAVEADRRVPVARDAERAAPGVGEAGLRQIGEELGQGLAQQRVHRGLAVEGLPHGGPVVVGRPAAAEGDAPVGGPLPVDDHVPVVGERGPRLETGRLPEVVAQWLGGHHERVHRHDVAAMARQRRGPGLRGPHHDVGPHRATARHHAGARRRDLDVRHRRVLVDTHAPSRSPRRTARGRGAPVAARRSAG